MASGKKGKATRFDWKDKKTRSQSNQHRKKKTLKKRGDNSKNEEEDHLGITERHQQSEIAAIFIQALDSPPKREW